MWRLFGRPRAEEAAPLRGELLGFESLEDCARTLAAAFELARDSPVGRHDLRTRLDERLPVLREAYLVLAGDVRRGNVVDLPAEWLLDKLQPVESEARIGCFSPSN